MKRIRLKGKTVTAHTVRSEPTTGKVIAVDRSSQFARAYGIQVSLDNGDTVTIRDIIRIH